MLLFNMYCFLWPSRTASMILLEILYGFPYGYQYLIFISSLNFPEATFNFSCQGFCGGRAYLVSRNSTWLRSAFVWGDPSHIFEFLRHVWACNLLVVHLVPKDFHSFITKFLWVLSGTPGIHQYAAKNCLLICQRKWPVICSNNLDWLHDYLYLYEIMSPYFFRNGCFVYIVSMMCCSYQKFSSFCAFTVCALLLI